MATFRGGVRETLFPHFGAGYPLGHLEFDRASLSIWGMGLRLDADRSAVEAVRLDTSLGGARVSVVWLDGSEGEAYFVAFRRGSVKLALHALGWPVEETKPRLLRRRRD